MNPIKSIYKGDESNYDFIWKNEYFKIERISNYDYINAFLEKDDNKICGKDNYGNNLYFPIDIDCPINKIFFSDNNEDLPGYSKLVLNDGKYLYYTDKSIEDKIIIDFRISSNLKIPLNPEYPDDLTNIPFFNEIDSFQENSYLYSINYLGINTTSISGNKIKKFEHKIKVYKRCSKGKLASFCLLYIFIFMALITYFICCKRYEIIMIIIFYPYCLYFIFNIICLSIHVKYIKNFSNKINLDFEREKNDFKWNMIILIYNFLLLFRLSILFIFFLINKERNEKEERKEKEKNESNNEKNKNPINESNNKKKDEENASEIKSSENNNYIHILDEHYSDQESKNEILKLKRNTIKEESIENQGMMVKNKSKKNNNLFGSTNSKIKLNDSNSETKLEELSNEKEKALIEKQKIIEELENENKILKKINNKNEEIIKQKDNLLEQKQSKINELEKEIKILKEKNNKNEALISQKEKMLEENGKKIEELKKINEEIESKNNELEEKNKNFIENNDKPINDLIELIMQNKKEIQLYKNSIPFEFKEGEKLICVAFHSMNDQRIYPVLCSNRKNFIFLEDQLYKKFPDCKRSQNVFMFKGNIIKKYKTLEENKIENGSVILMKIDDDDI